MGLMMLAASPGCTIEVSASGPQAEAAIEALADLVGNASAKRCDNHINISLMSLLPVSGKPATSQGSAAAKLPERLPSSRSTPFREATAAASRARKTTENGQGPAICAKGRSEQRLERHHEH